ncbi:preprotein translocase, yajc subunit [Limosilactobacillus secaliphilus]|uniref:Preprotein translocase, yajc subunit n=2 Tax=Limosilactobacillus secaliphilus TaxID=396268 RepID=A0A0R2I3L1_9LACO|nr:preprotein translocase, yajc subunit [Limosilactobacillus secaliphilus]
MILLLIALMYFFMIRPQQKQRRQHADMMSKLKPGDEVVTIGRLHGVVNEVNEKARTVTLDCEGIYLTFDMVAIQRVVSRASSATESNDQAASSSSADSASAAAESADSEDSDSSAAAASEASDSESAASDSAEDSASDSAEK